MPKLTRPMKGALGAREKVQAAMRHAGAGPRPYDPRRAAPVDAPPGDDHDLDQRCGSIGNPYTRYHLSPPAHLRDAARHWRGLAFSKILEIVEQHLGENRQLYTCGAGDRSFWMVERDVRAAWQAEHAVISGGAVDPELSAPRPRGVRHVYQPSGVFDAFDDREESEVEVSRLSAPQPRMERRAEDHIDVSGIGEDLDNEA